MKKVRFLCKLINSHLDLDTGTKGPDDVISSGEPSYKRDVRVYVLTRMMDLFKSPSCVHTVVKAFRGVC